MKIGIYELQLAIRSSATPSIATIGGKFTNLDLMTICSLISTIGPEAFTKYTPNSHRDKCRP